jgi:fatty-acid desaturase
MSGSQKKKYKWQPDEELGTTDIKTTDKTGSACLYRILFMSLNILIDIFVGQWIGPLAIAVVTVVFPITFLISSLGMAIGVGGGSVLSRALGAKS